MKNPNKYDNKVKKLRADEWMEIFNNASDSYQATHPHWHLEVLISLIKWGLRNLRYLIENGKITWNGPYVELHYPVEWDWKSPRDEHIIHGKQILGKITKTNTANLETAKKTFAKMMAARFNVMALRQFTNGAWFEKRSNAYIPYLPVELDAMVKEIKGQRKKDEAAEEIFRPFSIGVSRVAIPSKRLKENAGIPKKMARQFAKANQQIDIPGVSFKGEIGGRKMWAGLIFEIQPLIIDADKRNAYHRITVGLAFERKLVGKKIISVTPSEWPKKDKNAFWDKTIQGIDKLAERLIPKNERQGSVIIETNDGLKIVRALSNTKEINSAITWATNFVTKTSSQPNHAEQRRLLEELEVARTAAEKGKTLEKLVSCLFASIDGFTVRERIKTETEEIDLEILNASEDPMLRREEGIILVECKNWTSNCGKDEFVVFRTKMENRISRCSLGFLISWNGFAHTVTKEMLRGSRERLLIVPIEGKQIRNSVRDNSFQEMIMSSWNDALRI